MFRLSTKPSAAARWQPRTRAAFYFDIQVVDGTHTEDQKAQYIAEAFTASASFWASRTKRAISACTMYGPKPTALAAWRRRTATLRPAHESCPPYCGRMPSISSLSACAHSRLLRPIADWGSPNTTIARSGGAVSVFHNEVPRLSSSM